jgi:hypothetical protein
MSELGEQGHLNGTKQCRMEQDLSCFQDEMSSTKYHLMNGIKIGLKQA